MRAVFATSLSTENPLAGLEIGELPDTSKERPERSVLVKVKASALNHHDVFSLKGVGLPPERLPMVLGGDGAGIDDEGNEVIVHGVISTQGWRKDETLDPHRSLLSERYHGTMADYIWVPARNLVPKPPELSFTEAAALPTSWLTAYRMLFTVSPAAPGSTILVQGAGGGVSTALISLGKTAGYRVWVTSRSEEKRAKALALGAAQCFEHGERLPERVDVVFDNVGEATWSHSLRSLNPGGAIVTCGATSGAMPAAELTRVFFMQLNILGSTMGTRDELQRLSQFLATTGLRPAIDSIMPLESARHGFQKMLDGQTFGKIVFQH